MPDNSITQEESLAIIESMINKAKNQFSENGFAYLLWGWVILVCSLSQFVMQHLLHYQKFYLVWSLTWVALLVQIVYYRKLNRQKPVKTYTGEIIGYVWLVFVIMLMLTGIFVSRTLRPEQFYVVNIIILILYGMPTFLSGIILKFRPLILGGIFCWCLSVVASFIAPEFVILLISLAVIAAWIAPGYMLRSRYKKENL